MRVLHTLTCPAASTKEQALSWRSASAALCRSKTRLPINCDQQDSQRSSNSGKPNRNFAEPETIRGLIRGRPAVGCVDAAVLGRRLASSCAAEVVKPVKRKSGRPRRAARRHAMTLIEVMLATVMLLGCVMRCPESLFWPGGTLPPPKIARSHKRIARTSWKNCWPGSGRCVACLLPLSRAVHGCTWSMCSRWTAHGWHRSASRSSGLKIPRACCLPKTK